MALDFVINFNGDCKEALKLYTNAFGVEAAQVLHYKDVPQNPNNPLSAEELEYVVMATIVVDGTTIMLQDLLKFMQSDFNSNITINVTRSNADAVTALFNKLSEGGTVTCPLQKMDWSEWYGATKDKFGTSWQISVR